jgi:flagellar assembly factor FliW
MLMTSDHDIQDLAGPPPELQYVGRDTINFAAGIPGFAALHEFHVEDLGPSLRPFCRLRSAEEPAICFTVVAPGLLFPDYSVEIDAEQVSGLGLGSAEDAVTLVIVTVPRPPQPPTANLLGPLVINRNTGAAAQVVQHRSIHGVAEPIAGATD